MWISLRSRRLLVAVLLAVGMLSANLTLASAEASEMRLELPTKPVMAEILAVSGEDLLVTMEADEPYRLSTDGGVTWQTAASPGACSSWRCLRPEVGSPQEGVVTLWYYEYEDESPNRLTAYVLDLRTNSVGAAVSVPVDSEDVVSGRGSRLLLENYDVAAQAWTRQVLDVETGERGANLPTDFDARDLTVDGTVGLLTAVDSEGGRTSNLAVADASGSTTVIDTSEITGVRVQTAGDLVYYGFTDSSYRWRTCVRDLSLASSSCSAQPLWSGSYGFGATVTSQGVLVAKSEYHSFLASGTWYPVTDGSFGSAVPVGPEPWWWEPARHQESGLPILATFDLTGSYLVQPDNSGALERIADMPWAKFPVGPESLTLTPTSVVGSDMRNYIITDWEDESREHQTAWRRATSGPALGSEQVFASNGRGYPLASGDRLVEPFQRGDGDDDATQGRVVLHDGDATTTLRFDYFRGIALSGPYLLAEWSNRSTGGEFGTGVLMPSGEWTSHPDGIGLFGSLLLERPSANNYRVTDLTGKTEPITFTMDEGSDSGVNDPRIWGDWVSLTRRVGYDYEAVAYNYRTQQTLTQSGILRALGDGAAVVRQDSRLNVWSLSENALSALPEEANYFAAVAIDGNRVAYKTDTELVVKTVAGIGTSAPRSLGVVAPATFDLASGSWSADIDLTKPVEAGGLEIRDEQGNVVRSIDVPASTDGSLRGIAWDGKDDSGNYAPSGTYTFLLTNEAVDGSGAVTSAEGTTGPLGQVSLIGQPTDATKPVVVIASPTAGAVFEQGQEAAVSFSCADEDGGSGIASCTGEIDGQAVADGDALPLGDPGSRTLTVSAVDNAGNRTEATAGYTVFTSFGDNSGRLEAAPTVNTAIKAGATVPVKFSLGGDYGLSIFETGLPKWRKVNCATMAEEAADDQSPTDTGPTGLTYDATTGQYNYKWKTSKQWQGQCWTLSMGFSDQAAAFAGAGVRFDFRFDK